MGIFLNEYANGNNGMMDESLKHPNELMEAFILDEMSFLPANLIKEACEPGGIADQLVTEGKLRSKNTLVKMSKKDDLSRRTAMTCMQLAKDNKDPNFAKLVKAQQKKNEYKAKIIKRWSPKAERVAKKTQQEFLHGGSKGAGILPNKFKKFRKEDMDAQHD